jgi:hypothetical protein
MGISPLMLMSGAINFMADEDSIVELDQNLDAVEDFELLPKGAYPATCVLAEKRVSDNNNEYYYINFRIDPEDYPPDYDKDNAPEGTTMNYSRISVPKSNDRRSISNVKKLYRAMGLSLKTSKIDPDEWIDKKVRLVTAYGRYNGERVLQVQSVESLEA